MATDEQWTSTSRIAGKRGVKMLVYGNAGLGKTMMCATAPRPILISAESGLLSLTPQNIIRVHGANTPGITYDIPCKPVGTIAGFKAALKEAFASFKAGHCETICIDSLSEIAELCLADAIRTNSHGQKAFGEMADDIMEICKGLRDSDGPNIFLTTKQGKIEDADLLGPSLPGRYLNREIPYIFDETYHLHVVDDGQGKMIRVLQTQPDFKAYAKDRSGALALLEHPHIGNMLAKMAA